MNGIQVQLTGNVTRDVELRYSQRGSAWCVLGVAVNYAQGRDEKRTEKTVFIDVKVFNRVAENVAESVSKGSRITVVGRLESDQWEANDGSKRTSWSVIADTVAPDLRFATATITRNERSPGGSNNGYSAPTDTQAPVGDGADSEHNPFGVPEDSPF